MSKNRTLLATAAVLLVVAYFGASAYLKHRTISYINDFALYTGVDRQLEHGAVKVNPLTMNGQVKDITVVKDGLKIAANSFKFNALTRKATVEAIKIDGPLQAAEIDKVSINKYVLEDGVPKSTDIDITGLSIPMPALAKNADGKVSLNISIATEADFKNQVYEYTKFNIDAPELMDLDMSIAISGFDIKKYAAYGKISPEELGNNDEFTRQITEDLANLKLNKMTLRFKDAGIVAKYYIESFDGDGRTDEERKAELSAALDAYSESVESEFDARLAQDVKKFVLGEYSEVSFNLSPEEPVSIQSVAVSAMMGASTDELVSLLGLTYTVK